MCLECDGTLVFNHRLPLQLNAFQPGSDAEKNRMQWSARALRPVPRLQQEMLSTEDTKAKTNDLEKKRKQITVRSKNQYRWTLQSPDRDPQGWDWCIVHAKKGCSSVLHKPGHGPPWDFATQIPPTIDVHYFRAYQLISKRATKCWAFYQNALRNAHPVPQYILDQFQDPLLFREGFGMEVWYPVWFATIDLAAQPRDYGRLHCFKFEAQKIAMNHDRTEPSVGWNDLPYEIVLPGSLCN